MGKNAKTVSVRIPIEISIALDDESKSIGVSLNTLINQVIIKHAQWERFEKELGILHLSKESAKRLFSTLSKEEVITLASSSCKAMLKELTLFIKGQLNIENLIDVISIWLTANNTSFRHIKTSTLERFIIKHELGKNYSTYLGATIQMLFSEINKEICEISINERGLIFEIEL